MGTIVQQLQVFISSPGDVPDERLVIRDAINRWNQLHSSAMRLTLVPIMWEDNATPEIGRRTQHIVNRQIVDPADILIACFSTRLGTPTGKARSGTVEEIERFVRARKPVMLYFAHTPSQVAARGPEYKRLLSFKREYQSFALYHEYKSLRDLGDRVSIDLTRQVRDLVPPQQRDGHGEYRPSVEYLPSPQHLYERVSRAIAGCNRRKGALRVLRIAALHGLNTDLRWEEPPELSKVFGAFDKHLFSCIHSGEWTVQMLANITTNARLKDFRSLLKKAGKRGVFDLRTISPTQSALPILCPLVIGESSLFLATDHPGYHRAFAGVHLEGTRYADWGSQYFASLWNCAPFRLREGTRDNIDDLRRLSEEIENLSAGTNGAKPQKRVMTT